MKFKALSADAIEETIERDLPGSIRALRKLAKLPQDQTAAAVGITQPYLSQIERGIRSPRRNVKHDLVSFLIGEIDPADLPEGVARELRATNPRNPWLPIFEARRLKRLGHTDAEIEEKLGFSEKDR